MSAVLSCTAFLVGAWTHSHILFGILGSHTSLTANYLHLQSQKPPLHTPIRHHLSIVDQAQVSQDIDSYDLQDITQAMSQRKHNKDIPAIITTPSRSGK